MRWAWVPWLAAVVGCGGAPPAAAPVRRTVEPAAAAAFSAGVAAMEQGERARGHFARALAIQPTLWEARHNLGVLAFRAGDHAAALAAFEPGVRAPARARQALLAAALAQRSLGRFDEARAGLEALVDRRPGDLEARRALAVVLLELQEVEAALLQAREILLRDGASVEARILIARAHRLRNRSELASLILERTLAERPDRAELLNELGLLALDGGDTQAALRRFEEAMDVDPTFTTAALNAGAVRLRAGDYAGAASRYEMVLADQPDSLSARVALGASLRGLGRYDAARDAYEAVLEVTPEQPEALFNLAILQAEFLEQRAPARDLFQRFLDATTEGSPGRAEARDYLRILADAPP